MLSPGERTRTLEATLTAVMEHRPLSMVPVCTSVGGAWHLGLAAYSLAIGCRWGEGAELARQARAIAVDPEDVWLADGVAALTCAAIGSEVEVRAVGERIDELRALPADVRMFVQHLVREAAMASNAMALAAEMAARFDPHVPTESLLVDHPYLDVSAAAQARTLAWSGDITGAQEFLASWTAPRSMAGRWLLIATDGLVGGRAADRAGTVRLADQVMAHHPDPADYLASGCHLLVAYGLLAVGELDRAARHILVGGGGGDLPLLKAIDRALCLDGLTALAVEAGDLAAAEAWAEQAEPMLASAITRSTVQRLQARVALLADDPERARALAVEVAAADRAAGRPLDVAVAELLVAQAEIALAEPGAAQRRLERSVAAADAVGDAAVRRAAARELRKVGRRLRPAPGAGWEALTAREREVALLLASGRSNQAIADQLFLSPHTVRVHVSRVLAAYGLATRAPLPALLAEHLDPERPPLPELTPRQQQVAALVALGTSNPEIAATLEISVSAVEKHVTAVLRAWGLTSRAGIVAAVAGRTE